jgi:hypothetical protein
MPMSLSWQVILISSNWPFCGLSTLKKTVLYVLGNHEFYGQQLQKTSEKVRELTQNTNIHFLNYDELILDGVRFLGGILWTDFKLYGEKPEPNLPSWMPNLG